MAVSLTNEASTRLYAEVAQMQLLNSFFPLVSRIPVPATTRRYDIPVAPKANTIYWDPAAGSVPAEFNTGGLYTLNNYTWRSKTFAQSEFNLADIDFAQYRTEVENHVGFMFQAAKYRFYETIAPAGTEPLNWVKTTGANFTPLNNPDEFLGGAVATQGTTAPQAEKSITLNDILAAKLR